MGKGRERRRRKRRKRETHEEDVVVRRIGRSGLGCFSSGEVDLQFHLDAQAVQSHGERLTPDDARARLLERALNQKVADA